MVRLCFIPYRLCVEGCHTHEAPAKGCRADIASREGTSLGSSAGRAGQCRLGPCAAMPPATHCDLLDAAFLETLLSVPLPSPATRWHCEEGSEESHSWA